MFPGADHSLLIRSRRTVSQEYVKVSGGAGLETKSVVKAPLAILVAAKGFPPDAECLSKTFYLLSQ